jgi:hypothetical protein
MIYAFLQGPAQPQEPDALLYTGEDLIEWRVILENGLDTQERAERFIVFVQTYPQSPLAEVALARALESGVDIRDVLEPLDEPARRALLRSHRSHQARLRHVPPSGPTVTDAE